MTLSEETQMSMDLKPETTYTIFLLPFAYSPVQRDEQKAEAGGQEWRELAWDPPAPIVITDSDLRERILKQKKEELLRIVSDKRQDEIVLMASQWLESLKPEERQRLERMEERAVRDEADGAKLVWRLQYFLPETNMVLFDRAKWFELRSECAEAGSQGPAAGVQWPTKLTLNNGMESIPLKVHWARLTLFEWPEGLKKAAVKRRTFARNGILAIKVGFDPESNPSMHHLLALNETFRYYKIPFLRHPDVCFKRHEFFEGLPDPSEDEHLSASYNAMWENLLSLPLRKGEGCFSLFPEEWKAGARQQAMAEAQGQALPSARELLASPLVKIPSEDNSKEKGTWDVYPDNRAFVWTCADLDQISEYGPWPTFEGEVASSALRESLYTLNWHALLDVDATPALVDVFRYEWLRDRTYRRWATSGSLYGFNNFSVAVMGSLYPHVPVHFERMYLDMGMLLLQVRTSLFRASQKISRDTQARLEAEGENPWEEHFRTFRDDFAAFVNLYQFPLLSTQQQAIEMYAMMRKWMDIDDIFSEVNSEIEATHENAELAADKASQGANEATQRAINILTFAGVGFATTGVIAQLLGSSDFLSFIKPPILHFLGQFVVALVPGLLIGWLAYLILMRYAGPRKEED